MFACRIIFLYFLHASHSKNIRTSHIFTHRYKSLQSSLQEQLHLQQALSISELAIRFGCSDAVPKANSVIEHFLKSLSPAQRQFADCSRAVYSAAALTMACKLLNSAPDDKKRKVRTQTLLRLKSLWSRHFVFSCVRAWCAVFNQSRTNVVFFLGN